MREAPLEFANRVCSAVDEEGKDVRFPLRDAKFGKERFQAHARNMRCALQLNDQ